MNAQHLFQPVRDTWRLMFDPSVPVWTKLIPIFVVVYVVSPLDVVPDFLIGLGLLDDIAILFIGLRLFLMLVPKTRVVKPNQKTVNDEDSPRMWDGVVEEGEII